jgi:3-hydroxymyristoyl/3-hydroxydecanoyl-(acyl carrier protein) dehydratases
LRFVLLDRITSIEQNKICAEKKLSMAEEYLADHFPGFPVMPGVLILESMIQTSAWLMRVNSDFAHSMVLFKEAKAVRYKGFVAPGQTLVIESTVHQNEGNVWTFKCEGFIDGKSCCNARLSLIQFNLQDTNPGSAAEDEQIVAHYKQLFNLLQHKPLSAVST